MKQKHNEKGKRCAMMEILCLDNPNDDVPYLDKQQEKQAKEKQGNSQEKK